MFHYWLHDIVGILVIDPLTTSQNFPYPMCGAESMLTLMLSNSSSMSKGVFATQTDIFDLLSFEIKFRTLTIYILL